MSAVSPRPPRQVEADSEILPSTENRARRGTEGIVGNNQSENVTVGAPLDAQRISIAATLSPKTVDAREPLRYDRPLRPDPHTSAQANRSGVVAHLSGHRREVQRQRPARHGHAEGGIYEDFRDRPK